MMIKGSSSTLLSALVGLAALLCVVNEAQGIRCYASKGESITEFEKFDCSPYSTECENRGGTLGCLTYTKKGVDGAFKECKCLPASEVSEDQCHPSPEGDGTICICLTDLCNKSTSSGDGGTRGENGGTKSGATTTTSTPIMALSTLLSASALVIITSSYWTLF